MAMALVHGGSAIQVLSRSVFNCLAGIDIIVDIDEIPEAAVRDIYGRLAHN